MGLAGIWEGTREGLLVLGEGTSGHSRYTYCTRKALSLLPSVGHPFLAPKFIPFDTVTYGKPTISGKSKLVH